MSHSKGIFTFSICLIHGSTMILQKSVGMNIAESLLIFATPFYRESHVETHTESAILQI